MSTKPRRRKNRPTIHDEVDDQRLHAECLARLDELGFSQLRRDHVYDFGWRYWKVGPNGLLASPLVASEYDAPVIVASCHHGHTPPSPECSCGIFYVHDMFHFTDTLDFLSGQPRFDASGIVATWGVALNGHEVDRSAERWGIRPRRTGRYRILGIMTGGPGFDLRKLRETYSCPLVEGINLKHAWAIESLWDETAPESFADVVKGHQSDRESYGTAPELSGLKQRHARESATEAAARLESKARR
ncbi:hypothetical protein SAMN04488550_1175 [Gordonia malaquae]|uniref:Uncharacterized protein n=1 Tax=Gordonia malaquae NBRC 108250 TaxID=1223542 RepID=M3UYZ5_GORML|nr:hypothetical protein [Gordonia malaquae]GAC81157.1 hypothetical protein GM1_029_00600 [Gordonia malaquae NBRC 108250]SEC02072.1 hypothetical protein SAMN04488550_1175 [Gordonia malaquae]